MEKKVMIAALFLAMFVLSSDIKLVQSDSDDCIDACYTSCVFPGDDTGEARVECEKQCDERCAKEANRWES
ncbi:hypothetical protein DCAR_0933637 [Daucus carota subsp. sativus]|uniref:Uncharacterized protein n=1 Tax=Daucus carota subsp. sativus TaxID=79200 RepID=A0A175YEG9_DAUCS|nr:hypothetical protein DCAR_0933637 [Daucus carota subsp. sativus]